MFGWILRGASAVFVHDGVEGARMTAVAERAGVSVGSLYQYVSDKTDLLERLRLAWRADLTRRLDLALSELRGVALASQVDRVLDVMEAHGAAWPRLHPLLLRELRTEAAVRESEAFHRSLTVRAASLTGLAVGSECVNQVVALMDAEDDVSHTRAQVRRSLLKTLAQGRSNA